MATLLLDAELVIVEAAGHMASLEQPDAVNAAMARWLSKVHERAAQLGATSRQSSVCLARSTNSATAEAAFRAIQQPAVAD